MKIAKILKGSRLGRWLVVALCALVLTYASPRRAEATAVEYAVMLALIIVVCITAMESPDSPDSPAWTPVGNQLKAAASAANDGNSEGDHPKEIAGLSKTIGLAKAMMGIASSCDHCATVKTELQEIIELARLLKVRALNVAGACNPDGVVQGNEECDPLAALDGCPIITILPDDISPLSYTCSDECLCEPQEQPPIIP